VNGIASFEVLSLFKKKIFYSWMQVSKLILLGGIE
jgi:hypothetical protein